MDPRRYEPPPYYYYLHAHRVYQVDVLNGRACSVRPYVLCRRLTAPHRTPNRSPRLAPLGGCSARRGPALHPTTHTTCGAKAEAEAAKADAEAAAAKVEAEAAAAKAEAEAAAAKAEAGAEAAKRRPRHARTPMVIRPMHQSYVLACEPYLSPEAAEVSSRGWPPCAVAARARTLELRLSRVVGRCHIRHQGRRRNSRTGGSLGSLGGEAASTILP